MKLIISHDVDLLTTCEHLRDLLIIKRIVRNMLECTLGFASAREVFARLTDICKNRIHQLPELIKFDRKNNVQSTFFFGMANGMYLNYSLKQAEYWIEKVRDAGLQVGVHGIQYDDKHMMQQEFDNFKSLTGMMKFGIRMHYLRMSDKTIEFLETAGYTFDSSVEKLVPPYKIGRMWEFPLHIMDASIFYRGSRWINTTFDQAKQITLEMFEKAHDTNIPYFTINLHDPNFSPAYAHIYNWYLWLIHYAKENGIEFTDFYGAMKELEENST